MEIPVLIEPVPGNGYVATSGEPLALRAEGATRDEAVENFKEQMRRRLAGGTELVSLRVDTGDNPWLAMVGMFDRKDPDVQEWLKAMEENRRAADADPDYP